MEEWPLAWFEDDPWPAASSSLAEPHEGSMGSNSAGSQASIRRNERDSIRTSTHAFKRSKTIEEPADAPDATFDLTTEPASQKSRLPILDSFHAGDRVGGGGVLSNASRDPWAWSCAPHAERKGRFALRVLLFEGRRAAPRRWGLTLLAPPTRFGQGVSIRFINNSPHIFISDVTGTATCVDLSSGLVAVRGLASSATSSRASCAYWTHEDGESSSSCWFGFEDGSVSLLTMNTRNMKSKIAFSVAHPEDEPDGLASRLWRALPTLPGGSNAASSNAAASSSREGLSPRAVAALLPLDALAVFCVFADGRCVVVDATTPNWAFSLTPTPVLQVGPTSHVKLCRIPSAETHATEIKLFGFASSRSVVVAKAAVAGGAGYEIRFPTAHAETLSEDVAGFAPKGLALVKASGALISGWYDPSTSRSVFLFSRHAERASRSSWLAQRGADAQQDEDVLSDEREASPLGDASDADLDRAAHARLSLPHRFQARHVRRGVARALELSESALSTSNELLARFVTDQTLGGAQRGMWGAILRETETAWRADFDEILDLLPWTYEASLVVRPMGVFVLSHGAGALPREQSEVGVLIDSLAAIGAFAWARSRPSGRTMRRAGLPVTSPHPGTRAPDLSLWPGERYSGLQVAETLVESAEDVESEERVLGTLSGLRALPSASAEVLARETKAFLLGRPDAAEEESTVPPTGSVPLYMRACLTHALRARADGVRVKAWAVCLSAVRCARARVDSARSAELNAFAEEAARLPGSGAKFEAVARAALEIFVRVSTISALCVSPRQPRRLDVEDVLLFAETTRESRFKEVSDPSHSGCVTVGELYVDQALSSGRSSSSSDALVESWLRELASPEGEEWSSAFFMSAHQYPAVLAMTDRFASTLTSSSSLEETRAVASRSARASLGAVAVSSTTISRASEVDRNGWRVARERWTSCAPPVSRPAERYAHFVQGAKAFLVFGDAESAGVLASTAFDFAASPEEQTRATDLALSCALRLEDYVRAGTLASELTPMSIRDERYREIIAKLCESNARRLPQLLRLPLTTSGQIESVRRALLERLRGTQGEEELIHWTAFAFFMRHGLFATACSVLWELSERLLATKTRVVDVAACENACASCLSALTLTTEASFLSESTGRAISRRDVEQRLMATRAVRETQLSPASLETAEVHELTRRLLSAEKHEVAFSLCKTFGLDPRECVASLVSRRPEADPLLVQRLLRSVEAHERGFDAHLHAASVVLSRGASEVPPAWLERVLIFGHAEDDGEVRAGFGFAGEGRGDPVGYLRLLMERGRVLRAARLVSDLVPAGPLLLETKYLKEPPWLPVALLDELFQRAEEALESSSAEAPVDVRDPDDREALKRAIQLTERRLRSFFESTVSIELAGKNAMMNVL